MRFQARSQWTQISWATGAVAALIGMWIVVHAAEALYRADGLLSWAARAEWAPIPWVVFPLLSLAGILLDKVALRLTPVLLLLAGAAAFVTAVGSALLRDTLLFLLLLTCHEVVRHRAALAQHAPSTGPQ